MHEAIRVVTFSRHKSHVIFHEVNNFQIGNLALFKKVTGDSSANVFEPHY